MAKYAVTPWRHPRDLLAVRRQLYGESSERRHAVDRVMAWKMRGNLPHAVESTALLVDAILHQRVEGNSIFSVRAVYSAAFTRFVTGFCDMGRHKERSLEPSSMLDIAKQIGMPAAFVALRHEATHEELPAMQRIVKATEEALDWLWNVYWSRLEEPETEEALAASLAKVKLQSRDYFKSWRSSRREALRSKNQRQQIEEVQAAAKSCMDLIEENGANSALPRATAVAEVAVQDKLLLPSRRELGSSMDGAFLIWEDLLRDIARQQQHFLDALVEVSVMTIHEASLHKMTDAEIEGLCLWLLRAVDLAATETQRTALRRTILEWCCSHPGRWSYFVGQQLLAPGEPDLVEDWKDVLEASQLQQSQTEPAGDVAMADDVSRDVIKAADGPAEYRGWMRAATASRAPIGVVR